MILDICDGFKEVLLQIMMILNKLVVSQRA